MDTTHNRDLVVISENGAMTELYPTTNGHGVLIDASTNKMGENNQSVIPSNIKTLQELIDILGPGAFQKIIGGNIEIDMTLTQSGVAPDSAIVGEKIRNLEDLIASLLYKAITITSFSNNKNTAEKGSTVTDIILSYTLSKVPKSATLDGSTIEITTNNGSKTLSGLSLTSDKTWTLRVTDEKDAVATKTTSLIFCNGIYYGVSSSTTYNSDLINSMPNKVLSNSRARTVTVNAGADQYIFYCLPSSLGTCLFNVGGFDGGFTKVSTINFTNSSGYTENYDIYRSDNSGLGNTTIKVS